MHEAVRHYKTRSTYKAIFLLAEDLIGQDDNNNIKEQISEETSDDNGIAA